MLLAGADFTVVLAGRRAAPLEETGQIIGGPKGSRWDVLPTDVSDPAQVAHLMDTVDLRYGRLDALVNNAGYAPAAPLEDHTPAMIQDVFMVNAVAPATAIARAWPLLKRQGAAGGMGACVVNVSSYATLSPFPTLFAYAAAKSAVDLMAKFVASEGRPLGIRGFAVAPGAVETEMLRKIVDRDVLPPSRTLAPETVARVVVDCILGRRNADNGTVIYLPSP